MAGFPTESEQDYADTLDVINRAKIIYPHVFCFSGRPGTPAARIPRQVPRIERRRRAAMMRSAGEKLRREALKGMVGQQAPLIVERPDVGDKPAAYHGRLANYMPVRLEDPQNALASEILVQIRDVVGDVLIARVSPSE
jgi:threonylcarbamoyladenosine tRNA methylthiotransferase MtaB